jgi:hypothetical protein
MLKIHYFRLAHRGAVNRLRSRLLERMLARADAPTAVSDWRADAFRVIAPPTTAMPGVGAAALFAERGPVTAASVFIATPVHYVAEMSNVRLAADGILSLRQAEAEALAADFDRVWKDAGIRLLNSRCANLFCVVDQPTLATTCDPEDVLGRRIENHLPIGAAAPRLRQLMSEIEMWLFEHPVNRLRLEDGAPAVNGLWLWGGGPALTSLPPVDGWTAGDDVFFKAFAARADVHAGAGESANSGVAVIAAQPGSDAWRGVESRWLEPSWADLAAGRIARLDLSAGNRCVSLRARARWRFWRRPRPWWESVAAGEIEKADSQA